MIRIGIVVGEASGDLLAANLIGDLADAGLEYELTGIGGEKLTRLGCRNLFPAERLSVMGITEVAGRFIELINIRKQVMDYFIQNPPDIFIGVDAPDFNFNLEQKLRSSGIKTMHVVSPSVWAWREYRLKKIKKCIDMMLTLFPFETGYYEKYGIPAKFIGHPLADIIQLKTDKSAARGRLSLPQDKKIVALLPGSRQHELDKLIIPFLDTALWCNRHRDDLHFVTSLTNSSSADKFRKLCEGYVNKISIDILVDKTHDLLESADTALLASGTVALEALLKKCPMVVAYKLNWISYVIARMLVQIPYASLPNVLAGKEIVPEFIQARCKPDLMGMALLTMLDDTPDMEALKNEFRQIHQSLLRPASINIPEIVLQVVNEQ